jgi:hypothetical protein
MIRGGGYGVIFDNRAQIPFDGPPVFQIIRIIEEEAHVFSIQLTNKLIFSPARPQQRGVDEVGAVGCGCAIRPPPPPPDP